MNLIKSAIATASAAAILLVGAMPAKAGSDQDSRRLIELVEGTGTQVSFNTNEFDKNCKGKNGYYTFAKDKVDYMAVCVGQTDMKNPDEVWETVAHESIHVAQACLGQNPLLPPKYHPRLLRELRTLAPHYAKQLVGYSGAAQLKELEAFWAELQAPSRIIELFKIACYEQD